MKSTCRILLFAAVGWMAIGPGFADTIILQNNGSLNGKVKYSNGQFTISGVFQGQSEPAFAIPADQVKSVRFNGADRNADAPPADIRARSTASKGEAKPPNCEITFTSGTSRKGLLDRIDEKEVRMKDSPTVIPRSDITALRLLQN